MKDADLVVLTARSWVEESDGGWKTTDVIEGIFTTPEKARDYIKYLVKISDTPPEDPFWYVIYPEPLNPESVRDFLCVENGVTFFKIRIECFDMQGNPIEKQPSIEDFYPDKKIVYPFDQQFESDDDKLDSLNNKVDTLLSIIPKIEMSGYTRSLSQRVSALEDERERLLDEINKLKNR
jgi:hypothetical protein